MFAPDRHPAGARRDGVERVRLLRGLRRRVIVPLLALGFVGGAHCSGTRPPADAAADHTVAPDAAPDATLRVDARPDSTLDASTDGWTRYAELPARCAIERATDPAASVPPLRWQACRGGAPGCQELVVAWGSDAPAAERLLGDDAAWSDGTQTWLAVTELLANQQARIVVGSARGELAAAWRFPRTTNGPFCILDAPTVGDGVAAVVIAKSLDTSDPFYWGLIRTKLHAGSTDRVGPLVTLDQQNGARLLPQERAVNRSLWAGDLSGAWIVRATGRFDIVARSTQDGELVQGQPAIVGTDVLYADYYHPRPDGSHAGVVMLQPLDGAAYPLVDTPGYDVLGVRSDGRDLAWVVGVAPATNYLTYNQYELWAAPFARTAAQLQPRRVAAVDDRVVAARGQGELGYGRFVEMRIINHTAGQLLRVYALSDGTYYDVPPPTGAIWGDILAVTPDEFIAEIGQLGDEPGTIQSIVRQRFDALGPPAPRDP